MSYRKTRKDIDKATTNLMKYVELKPAWSTEMDDFISSALDDIASFLSIDYDDLASHLEENDIWQFVFPVIADQFVTTAWSRDDNIQDGTFVDEYVEKRRHRESPTGLRYLNGLNKTELRLWEIIFSQPGSFVRIRPFGSTEKTIKVMEQAASEHLEIGDCLAARVVDMGNINVFSGGIAPVNPEIASNVLELVEDSRLEAKERFYDMLRGDEENVKDVELEALTDSMAQRASENLMFRFVLTVLVSGQFSDQILSANDPTDLDDVSLTIKSNKLSEPA